MDGSRFDRLARQVGSSGSRRTILQWAAASMAGGAFLVWRPGTARAADCQPGTFVDGANCTPCPPGRFSSQINSQTCTQCEAGFVQPNSGQAQCIACPQGKFQPNAGESQCNDCPTGTSQNLTGQNSCVPCPAGSVQPQTGKTTCNQCPAGTAQPNSGQTTCPACADASTPPGSKACGGTCPASTPKVCPGQNGKASICCKRKRKCKHKRDGTPRCKKKRKK